MQCRCSYCGRRKTLAMRVARYIRPPSCDRCGRSRWREDHWRVAHERGKGVTCWCHKNGMSGTLYWFPHRKGSKLCGLNPKFTVEVAQQWAQDRGLT